MTRAALLGLVLAVVASGCTEDDALRTLGEQCDLSSECDAPLVCRLERCRRECATTRDCPLGALCVRDQEGLGACLLPEEASCSLDSECPEPLRCLGGGCTNECTIDRDCAPGARCARDSAGDRYCDDPADQPCVLHSECAPLVCAVDGVCRDACLSTRDCREGTFCIDGTCERPPRPDGGAPMDAGTDGGGHRDGGVLEDAAIDAAAMDAAAGCSTAADCTAPGVSAADCVAGSCTVVDCDAHRGDCDGAFDNGCETTTADNPEHCNGCGNNCGAYGRCFPDGCDGIVDLSLGEAHSCFVRGNGLVLCAGYSEWGQLGRGAFDDAAHPDPFPAYMLTGVVAAELGQETSCALLDSRELRCFGKNLAGELGDGTYTSRSRPVTPSGLSDVEQLSLGWESGCAVDGTGQLYCWGGSECGENGLAMQIPVPTAVTGFDDVVDVGLGGQHTCVVRAGGTVECVGQNRFGELGDGVATHADTCNTGQDASFGFVGVTGISDAVQVGTGAFWSCARHATGAVSCWGTSKGSWGTTTSVPAAVAGISDASHLSVGSSHACVVHATGRVSCWGDNGYGKLGAGDTAGHAAPVDVGLTGIAKVETGDYGTCAVSTAGSVWCWGYNFGQLGPEHVDETLSAPTPVTVLSP